MALTSSVGLSRLEMTVESREMVPRCILWLQPPEVCEAAQTRVNEAWVQRGPGTGLAWRISLPLHCHLPQPKWECLVLRAAPAV